MNAPNSREPFFNFTEPVPAYLAGGLILLFMVFSYVPGIFALVRNIVVLRPLGFQNSSYPEQIFSLMGHGLMHGGWSHILLNASMIAVLGVATVKGARLKSVSQGRRRSPNLIFLTIFIFGVILGGIFQWLWWAVINADLTMSAPAAVGASGGASALLATAGWAMGGRYNLIQFAFGWALINVILVVLGPFIGMNIAWAAHIGGFVGGALLAPSLIKAKSTSIGL